MQCFKVRTLKMEIGILKVVGLLLDIAGVIGLYLFGLTPRMTDSGHQVLVIELSKEERTKAMRHKVLSVASICALGLGFLLQLLPEVVYLFR